MIVRLFSKTLMMEDKNNKINIDLKEIDQIVQNRKARLINKNIKFPIYLDYNSTTPVDIKVLEQMIPYFNSDFGNPHSRTHSYGWSAEEAVEKAREQVAKVINCETKEIVFTSGGTEANNLAIKGAARFYKSDTKNHILTISTEHKCIIETCRNLEDEGFEVTYLDVEKDGLIDLEKFAKAIRPSTILASVMLIQNETGVIQDLKSLGKICRDHNILFHSDIVQGFGKIPIDVEECNLDLVTISAHKIYGPKGIGALYVRKKPRVRLKSIFSGGGQERGMRSGTNPTPLIVGFGLAAEIAVSKMEEDRKHYTLLSNKLLEILNKYLDYIYVNGNIDHRYPGSLNISFEFVEGESLIMAIKDLALSSGSACTSASLESSYVLRGMGVDEALSHTSLRISFGRYTSLEEVEYAGYLIVKSVLRLRELSPLWEMKQEGIDINSIEWSH